MGRRPRAGFVRDRADLHRREFGVGNLDRLDGGGIGVVDEVSISLEIEAVLEQEPGNKQPSQPRGELTMKAIRMHEPAGISGLAYEEVPDAAAEARATS